MATQDITTDKDSHTYEPSPDTTHGADNWLVVRGEADHRERAYIGFDISSAPAASQVTAVDLYLYLYLRSGSLTGRFNRITGAWTESGLTWNNAPTVTVTHQITHTIPTENGWQHHSITDLYKDAKNAGNRFGVRIMDHNESNQSEYPFSSRDGVSNYPYIKITYTPVPCYVKTSGDDSKNGLSWTNAWKTINKAATTVLDGTTVHIETGTYDQEPSSNKIAPQNIGTTGIYYEFTGTVTVEQNT